MTGVYTSYHVRSCRTTLLAASSDETSLSSSSRDSSRLSSLSVSPSLSLRSTERRGSWIDPNLSLERTN